MITKEQIDVLEQMERGSSDLLAHYQIYRLLETSIMSIEECPQEWMDQHGNFYYVDAEGFLADESATEYDYPYIWFEQIFNEYFADRFLQVQRSFTKV